MNIAIFQSHDKLNNSKHVVAAVIRTLDGFITYRDDPGPIAFFLDTSSFSFLFKISFYIAQTVIGDSFVVRFPFHLPLALSLT